MRDQGSDETATTPSEKSGTAFALTKPGRVNGDFAALVARRGAAEHPTKVSSDA